MIPAKTTLKLEYIRRDGYVNTADQVLNSGHLHGCRVVACGVRAGVLGLRKVGGIGIARCFWVGRGRGSLSGVTGQTTCDG